jgi:hypothetical protein
MTRTGYTLPRFSPDEVAVGYRGGERWGTFLERPSYASGPSWNLKGNGGIQSTVGDMLRWHEALEGDRILSAASREKLVTRHVDEGYGDSWYGYGWALFDTPRGTRLVAHNGGNGIFSADFRRYVDEGVVVFVTSNSSEFFIDPISETMARIAFGLPHELPPAVVELSRETLDEYAGTYRLSDEDAVEVRREGNALELVAVGEGARALLAGSDASDAAGLASASERTLEIVERWIGGDVRGIHEALSDAPPLEELRAMLGEFRGEVETAHGPLESAEVALARAEELGFRITVALRHERGTTYAAFDWEGGDLVGIEPVDEPGAGVVRVWPVSMNAFTSFHMGSRARLTVRFEYGEGGVALLVIESGAGVAHLLR